jgi:hypothetical protein
MRGGREYFTVPTMSEVHMLRSSIAGILVLLPVCLLAQKTDDDGTRGTKITFHVTSVRQEDLTDCDPDKCSSKKYTIEGYADGGHTDSRTAYVLTCTEALVYKPTPHVEGACARVHANTDYDAELYPDSISFWPKGSYTPPPFRVLYSIESEKEVRK